MRWTRNLVCAAVLLCAPHALLAQGAGGMVTGRVIQAPAGQALPGVSVVVDGTNRGAVTDADGRYTITGVTPGAHRISASLLGYATETREITLTAGQTATADFGLSAKALQLEGIVAVGYGSMEKRDVAGSVATVQASEVNEMPVQRVDQALAGKAPGVQVQTTNNQPGADMRIRIRGGNSLSGDNDPLVVIDGVLGADLNLVNPNDIQSISVLKDASQTAIYGARGANGVIVVTTKRGRAGKPQLQYSGYYGMQDVSKRIPMMTADQQARLLMRNPNHDPSIQIDTTQNLGAGTDWQDVIFRAAPIQNHQLSLSGGNESTRYFLSGSVFDQQGVVRNSDFLRSSLRLNLDQNLSDRFRVGTHLSLAHTLGDRIRVNGGYGSGGGTATMAALEFSPLVPVYDQDGQYSGPLVAGDQLDNPLAILNDRTDKNTGNHLLGNVFGEYDLIPGLTWRTSASYTLSTTLRQRYSSRDLLEALNLGSASVDNTHNTDWLVENTLTFDRVIHGVHSFNVVGGFTAEEYHHQTDQAAGTGFTSDELMYNRLNLANQMTSSSSASINTLLSWLGRANYVYDGKYILTVSGRADGSSKFAKNNKWAFFPSAALGWVVSEEPFMQSIPAIDQLKLRASYGKTGSQAISSYQSLAAYSIGSEYTYGDTWFGNGARPSRVPNPDLKWETTAQFDAGFDLGLFDEHLAFTADYYNKTTTDLLYNKQVPYITGYDDYTTNVGSLRNRGLEFSLNLNDRVGSVDWNLGGNISFNRNKVLDLGGDQEIFQDGVNGALTRWKGASITRVGEPTSLFYGYVWDGIWQDSAAAASSGQAGAEAGGMKIKDINGDGVIDENDKTIIGNPHPDYTFGLTGGLDYRNFDLNVAVVGVQGNDIANLVAQGLTTPGGSKNQLQYVANYWTGPGSTNTVTALGKGGFDGMNSRWIQDGSYVRVQNITLGYTVPEGLTGQLHTRSLRLYVSAQNPFTFTSYSWYDPEVNSRGDDDLQLGWDDGNYPGTRTLTVGLNVGF